MDRVHVRVPATTANLGPGFDCLGIALRIYNTITISRSRRVAPDDMVSEAAMAFFSSAKIKPFAFSWKVTGDVPPSRGLGSSVTIRLGILCGLNELAGRPLNRNDLFHLCTKLEGHPDNAAPAVFGGFTIVPPTGPLQHYPVEKSLTFVLLVPDFEIRTPDARKVLPKSISISDAIISIANAAAIAGAFAAADYRKLTECFDDRLHQPYRERLLPGLSQIIQAGRAAGALGGWLSGSGSTIACVTMRHATKISEAMSAAAGRDNSHAFIVSADNMGVQILK